MVGLGYWGPNIFRNFIAQPSCRMLRASDLSENNIQKMRALYPAVDYSTEASSIFSDPAIELVLIATPTSTHYPLVTEALKAGKHVFVEKPMCASIAEAEVLIALAEEKGKRLFVDHTFAYAPAVTEMRRRFEAGELGGLLYFDSTRINLGIIQLDTNVLWDLAVHDLTILSQMKNLSDVTDVCCHGTAHYGKQIEVAHLHLTFKDGFMAHIHVSWLSPAKMRKTIVAGTDAMMIYDDIEPSEKLRVYDRGVVRGQEVPNPMLPTYRVGNVIIPALSTKETLSIAAADVLECVRNNNTPRVSGKDGLSILKILTAADRSMQENDTVHVA